MVAYAGVMSDVIPAPDEDIVSDFRARLDGHELQHEAVVTNPDPAKVGSARADVADEFITANLCFLVLPRPEPVEVLVADGDKHLEVAGRVSALDFLEGDHRQAKLLLRVQVRAINREADDLM